MRITLSLLAAVLAQPALASMPFPPITEDGSRLSYGLSLHNDGSGDPLGENYTQQLTYRRDYSLGASTGLGVSLTWANEIYQDDHYSSRFSLGLHPSYDLGNGTIGGYLFVGTNEDRPETQYGIEGLFAVGPVDVETYFGTFLDDGDAFGALGVSASYGLSDGLDIYAAHRRDFDDSGYFALSTIGVSYALATTTSSSSMAAPLLLTFEASRFHDDGESFSDSDWNQFSLSLTYVLGDSRRPILGDVRSVDYFYD